MKQLDIMLTYKYFVLSQRHLINLLAQVFNFSVFNVFLDL